MESPWARFSPWTLSKQRCRLVKRCVALLPLVFPGSVALPLVRGIRQTPLGHFNSFVSHDVRSLADASSSVPGADRGSVFVCVFSRVRHGATRCRCVSTPSALSISRVSAGIMQP